jgi:DNA-binding MarR family transcriptional regulator
MPRVFRVMRRAADAESSSPPPALKELFKSGALGPRHIPVLVVLMLDGPQTVGELARRLGLSLATLSLMSSELARAGLVERHEDEQDRRCTRVSIAERYRRRLTPFVEQRLAPLRRALERMPPELREAFLAGWHVLAEEVERSQSGAA